MNEENVPLASWSIEPSLSADHAWRAEEVYRGTWHRNARNRELKKQNVYLSGKPRERVGANRRRVNTVAKDRKKRCFLVPSNRLKKKRKEKWCQEYGEVRGESRRRVPKGLGGDESLPGPSFNRKLTNTFEVPSCR